MMIIKAFRLAAELVNHIFVLTAFLRNVIQNWTGAQQNEIHLLGFLESQELICTLLEILVPFAERKTRICWWN